MQTPDLIKITIISLLGISPCFAANVGTSFVLNKNIINVQDTEWAGGAKCNGVANDTAAFQAAETAAEAAVGNDYWGPDYIIINIPAGNCLINGITTKPRIHWQGQGRSSTTIGLRSGSNTSLFTVAAVPNTWTPQGTATFTWTQFNDMTLSGNSGGQSATSHGIYLVDDNNSFYSAGAIIQNVSIMGFRNDGVYIGVNRNNSYIFRLDSVYNLGNGITNYAYDLNIGQSNIGKNGGAGLEQVSRGCTRWDSTDSYGNAVGIKLDSGSGCWIDISNSQLNANLAGGIDVESGAAVNLANTTFYDNSVSSSGGAPHILLNNASAVLNVSNSIFGLNSGQNPVNYLIQETLGKVNWGGGNSVNYANGLPYTLSAFSTNKVNSTPVGSLDNLIINPDFTLARKWATTSVQSPNGSAIYPLDHWISYGTTASNKYTTSQDSATPPTGFNNDVLITVNGAYSPLSTDKYYLAQKIEGIYTNGLGWGTADARSSVLSYLLKTSITGNFGVTFTAGGSNAYYSMLCPVTSANVWTYCSFYIPEPTIGTWGTAKNTVGAVLYFDIGSGSSGQAAANYTWTSGSGISAPNGGTQLINTAGATMQIANVRLRAGFFDTPYLQRPTALEYILAARYYQSSFPEGTAAGQNKGVSGANCISNPIANGQPSTYIQFSPLMATSPIVTTYNPSATNANWRNVPASSDVTVSVDPASAKSMNGVEISTGTTTATIGQTLCIHWDATAELP